MCAPEESMKTTEIKKKADLYLSCDEPTLEFAQTLKQEVESRCNLTVALDNDDSWEDAEDSDVLENMQKAKLMIVVTTGHSNITAWVMDYSPEITTKTTQQAIAERFNFQRCCKPPAIDFSRSHKEGLNEFMDLLRRTTGWRRFTKPSSNKLWNSIANAIFI
ncbi:unnamed protein product [Cylindrotheca closterium]|uniref:Uncharacterized protein n=1 Tax=Cylindrotheca closterium TaxID=2856 RepID=A0AAD2FMZ4_9STRA|nr:unnamed protein product [Cylindrotheca closterium]